MAKELITLNEFEMLAMALKNNKNADFSAVHFGYCTACKTITQYQERRDEKRHTKTCLKCDIVFETLRFNGYEFSYNGIKKLTYISDPDHVPNILLRIQKKLRNLRSRNHQKDLFISLLIKRLKEAEKGLKNYVFKLNKLELCLQESDLSYRVGS